MVMMPHWPPCGKETLTRCECCGCEATMSSDRSKASAVTAGHSKDRQTHAPTAHTLTEQLNRYVFITVETPLNSFCYKNKQNKNTICKSSKCLETKSLAAKLYLWFTGQT